jgi:adenylate kinase family enzyme
MIQQELSENQNLDVAVVLLGPPASGKGTIATKLKDHYGWHVITPGDIYRKLREEDSELGLLVRETLEKYHHCPDDLTNKIVMDAALTHSSVTSALDVTSHMVIDGYPRSFEQLEFLDAKYNVRAYVHIDASLGALLNASVNRRYCRGCQRVFSAKNPPRQTGPYAVELVDGDVRTVLDNGVRINDIVDIKNVSRPFMKSTCLQGSNYSSDLCAARSEDNWEFRWDDGEEKYKERIVTFESKTTPIINEIAKRPNYKRFKILEGIDNADSVITWLDSLKSTSN